MTSGPAPLRAGIEPPLTVEEILAWLREDDAARLESLWAAADEARARFVGNEVHLRGLIEISNYCVRGCTYCGICASNHNVDRYRLPANEE